MIVCNREEVPDFDKKHGKLVDLLGFVRIRTKYSPNEIRVYEDDVCVMILYNIYGEERSRTEFSKQDLDIVLGRKWYVDNSGYVSTTDKNGVKIRFHRMLFPGVLTDHKDSDKMNNTRENLQQVTYSVNSAKTKTRPNNCGCTGVCQVKSGKWEGRMIFDGITKRKLFDNKEDAMLYRYILELENLGEDAPQIERIKENYPYLLNYISVRNEMKFSDDIENIKMIGNKLLGNPHCPCSIVESDKTICPCVPCRSVQKCHCGMFVKKDNETHQDEYRVESMICVCKNCGKEFVAKTNNNKKFCPECSSVKSKERYYQKKQRIY